VLNSKLDGFSGADIEMLCREAGMIALRENLRARKISKEHINMAIEIRELGTLINPLFISILPIRILVL